MTGDGGEEGSAALRTGGALAVRDAVAGRHATPLTIPGLFPATATTDEEIVSGGRRLSYAAVRSRITRLAHMLVRLGVEPGTVVAVMNWDDHRYLECYFAVPGIGAILQTVNIRLSPDLIAFTLRHSGARVLLYHADFAPLVERLAGSLPDIRTLVAFGGADASTDHGYEELLDEADPDFVLPAVAETAVATTFHTSGTVGTPKAVSFTHRQIVLHTLALTATLANQPTGQGFRRDDVYMPLTPMFHVHAWGMPYVATMLGAKQVYPGRYDPAAIIALHDAEGVTVSHCVPTILDMILAARNGRTFDRWTMVIGGSPLSASLAQRAARAGIATVAGFGMSETGPVVALSRAPDDDPASLRRAGYPLPLTRARIDGEGTGELLLRAPWLTSGYSHQPAESDALWRGGWLHTGDVARITARGEIEIVDRIKDVIKSGGEWISSPEIEELAMRHPAVAAAALVAAPDTRWGERPVLFAVRSGDDPLDDVGAFLAQFAEQGRISRLAVPDRIIEVASLPLTGVGKIDKKALRARLIDEAS